MLNTREHAKDTAIRAPGAPGQAPPAVPAGTGVAEGLRPLEGLSWAGRPVLLHSHPRPHFWLVSLSLFFSTFGIKFSIHWFSQVTCINGRRTGGAEGVFSAQEPTPRGVHGSREAPESQLSPIGSTQGLPATQDFQTIITNCPPRASRGGPASHLSWGSAHWGCWGCWGGRPSSLLGVAPQPSVRARQLHHQVPRTQGTCGTAASVPWRPRPSRPHPHAHLSPGKSQEVRAGHPAPALPPLPRRPPAARPPPRP